MKVWQWQELNKPIDTGFFSRMIRFVSILTETPEGEIETLPTKQLIESFKTVQHLGQINDNNKEVINIGIELHLVPFSELTLGQFIDLETLVTEGYQENLCKIVSTLYLQKSGGGFYENEFEPFGKVNVNTRALSVEDLDINEVLGAVNKYLAWRETFFASYDIFKDPLEDVDETNATPEELKIIQEEKEKIEQAKGTQWINIINALSATDMTKFETILNTNVYLAFNQLTYINNQTKQSVSTL
jgi:hypothetical protein